MNLLVIDDNSEFLTLMQRLLEKRQIQAYTAENGLQALEILDDHPVDIILCDVLMPETHVMSLICTLKNIYPSIPLILVSGLPKGPLVKHSLSLGADDFIPKPVNTELLFETLTRFSTRPAA
jgi:CheY-like chemotaxis protein